jgi:hypothetical protein
MSTSAKIITENGRQFVLCILDGEEQWFPLKGYQEFRDQACGVTVLQPIPDFRGVGWVTYSADDATPIIKSKK